MSLIRGFRELNVYQRGRVEAKRVFEITKTFPREEKFSLTDQIRRLSRSVNSMIAEAWGHCRYPAAFTENWMPHGSQSGSASTR